MKQESLKKNFFMNIILTMSSFIFPIITFPYVSRILLPSGTGKVAFATSIVSYFSIFAQLGIPTYGIRACAKVRDNKDELTRTAHELIFIGLIMTLITYTAFAIALFMVPRFKEEKELLIVISISILLNTLGVEWLYKALEQYSYITLRSLSFKVIALISMFFLVRSETDYVRYGFITIFASSASNIFNFFYAHKFIGIRPVGNYSFRRHWKPIIVFFAMACATTIYTHLDVVMLGFMKNDIDVGYYNAAVKIKTILVSIVTSLGAVILPRVSYIIEKENKEEFFRVCKKALNFVLLFAVPLTTFFMVFAKEGIFFLSGDAFAGSILPMQIIMPSVVLIGVSNIFGIQMLIPTGKESIVLYSEIAGALVDVVLNAILIPKMGPSGAAIGTVGAEAVVLLVQYSFLKKEIKIVSRGIHFLRLFSGTMVAIAISSQCRLLNLSNFLTLTVSGLVFFGIYILYMLAWKEEIFIEVKDILIKYFNRAIFLVKNTHKD